MNVQMFTFYSFITYNGNSIKNFFVIETVCTSVIEKVLQIENERVNLIEILIRFSTVLLLHLRTHITSLLDMNFQVKIKNCSILVFCRLFTKKNYNRKVCLTFPSNISF